MYIYSSKCIDSNVNLVLFTVVTLDWIRSNIYQACSTHNYVNYITFLVRYGQHLCHILQVGINVDYDQIQVNCPRSSGRVQTVTVPVKLVPCYWLDLQYTHNFIQQSPSYCIY